MPRTREQELGAAEGLLTAWGHTAPERRVDYNIDPQGSAYVPFPTPFKPGETYSPLKQQEIPREYYKEWAEADTALGELGGIFTGFFGGSKPKWDWIEQPGKKAEWTRAVSPGSPDYPGFTIGDRGFWNEASQQFGPPEERDWIKQNIHRFYEIEGRWPSRWEVRNMTNHPAFGRATILSPEGVSKFKTAQEQYGLNTEALQTQVSWDALAGSLVGRMGALRRESPQWEPGPGYRSVQQPNIIQRERS